MTKTATSAQAITVAEKRAALSTVLRAKGFEAATRRHDFLTYIVEEEIAGRGADIRGKTIAQDVYGRDPFGDGDPENVVRVDARRLRDILDLYYETGGRDDPVRIHLDSGGYCPRFERVSHNTSPERPGTSKRLALPLLALVSGIFLGAAGVAAFLTHSGAKVLTASAPGADIDAKLIREAVYDKSPSSLQAINLAEQARGMIFPIFDRPRQALVADVFSRVIELDQDYHGGFAGAGQTIATLAILATDSAERDALLEQASGLARHAVELEPADAWSQSALAWCEFASGNYEEAFRLSSRATQLDPNDGHVLDFHGAIALFSGNFAEALATSDREFVRGGSNQRFANRNIYAAASFHLGKYTDSISGFEEATSFGDPISAPALAYHAAALNALGRRQEALRKLEEMARAWPDAPVDTILRSIHGKSEDAETVLAELADLGWSQAKSEPGSGN